MIEWLKTSVLGIILLGAIGSLLAVGLVKIGIFALNRLFRPALGSIIGTALSFIYAPELIFERLRTSAGVHELIATSTIMLATFVFSAGAFLAGFTMAVIGVGLSSSYLLFSGSLLFFCNLPFFILSAKNIVKFYDAFMSTIDAEAIKLARKGKTAHKV